MIYGMARHSGRPGSITLVLSVALEPNITLSMGKRNHSRNSVHVIRTEENDPGLPYVIGPFSHR